jgi:2-iminobutanoate/2-iminopropanoate deaminase
MSKKEIISKDNALQNHAPYSQGILTEDFLYVSGQGPADPDTGEHVNGGVEAQTEQTLENLKSIVHSAGGSFENIAKTTVYLKSMDDYDAMNKVYAEYFDSEQPARVCIEAGRLPGDIDVEIEALALMD